MIQNEDKDLNSIAIVNQHKGKDKKCGSTI